MRALHSLCPQVHFPIRNLAQLVNNQVFHFDVIIGDAPPFPPATQQTHPARGCNLLALGPSVFTPAPPCWRTRADDGSFAKPAGRCTIEAFKKCPTTPKQRTLAYVGRITSTKGQLEFIEQASAEVRGPTWPVRPSNEQRCAWQQR